MPWSIHYYDVVEIEPKDGFRQYERKIKWWGWLFYWLDKLMGRIKDRRFCVPKVRE